VVGQTNSLIPFQSNRVVLWWFKLLDTIKCN
jgi:hypothetical protein